MSILKESIRAELRGLLYEEATRWISSPEGQHFLDDVLPKFAKILERAAPFILSLKAPMTVHVVHHFSSDDPTAQPEPASVYDYPREGEGREPFGPIPPVTYTDMDVKNPSNGYVAGTGPIDDHSDCYIPNPGPLKTMRDCHGDGHYYCRTCARREES